MDDSVTSVGPFAGKKGDAYTPIRLPLDDGHRRWPKLGTEPVDTQPRAPGRVREGHDTGLRRVRAPEMGEIGGRSGVAVLNTRERTRSRCQENEDDARRPHARNARQMALASAVRPRHQRLHPSVRRVTETMRPSRGRDQRVTGSLTIPANVPVSGTARAYGVVGSESWEARMTIAGPAWFLKSLFVTRLSDT